ncbi:MAG: 30S ribosomal protein S20 [Firmicutes bacterium]|nr:30S ribosomal protein S20 [Bacillota bacterium]
MPNIKSAMKRAEISRKRAVKNAAERSTLKTAVKRFKESQAAGSEETVKATFTHAVSLLDRAAQKGLIHKNAAARKKSQLAKKLGK